MPAQASPDGKRIILNHPKGPSVEILLFGATVLSWKSRNKDDSGEATERLFVSSKAVLDGSKAVRGGIPVVYPFFGAPTKEEHKLIPQHGFARVQTWAWDGSTVMDNDTAVSVRLTSTPSVQVSHDSVELAYVVTVSEHQLSTDLHVKNTATSESSPPVPAKPVEFQALLHTYIRAPANEVRIKGLHGLTYTDKTAPTLPEKQEERLEADVQNFTDYMYHGGPGEYELIWPGGGLKVKAIGMKDVVVWRPSSEIGSKLNDMEEGGWDKFVCVEPGHVVGWASVEPGKTWIGGQTLSLIN